MLYNYNKSFCIAVSRAFLNMAITYTFTVHKGFGLHIRDRF